MLCIYDDVYLLTAKPRCCGILAVQLRTY